MNRFLRIFLLFFAVSLAASAQEVIRVTGVVKSKDSKKPLYQVAIYDFFTKKKYETDIDGRFAFDTSPKATLSFTYIFDPVTVKVKGRNYIEVYLKDDIFMTQLDTAGTTVRALKTNSVEATTMEVFGDTMRFGTNFHIRNTDFANNCRLVAQGRLINKNTGDTVLTRPIVIDAPTYHLTQERLYGLNKKGLQGDPLAPFITILNDSLYRKQTKDYVIPYTDTVLIENKRDLCYLEVRFARENYLRILSDTTVTIAKGFINPMRWLDYDLHGWEIADSAYFPKQNLSPRPTGGSIDLRFPVNKAVFDLSDPHNAAEMKKLEDRMKNILGTSGASILSVKLTATASPEGNYARNAELADERLGYALQTVSNFLPERLREGVEMKKAARVASWKEVADLLRKDSLNDEADAIENIIAEKADPNRQGAAIRKLACYTLIKEKYLPQLRSMAYEMRYIIQRKLLPEEIKENYEKDYHLLDRAEFFTLYRAETDTLRKEKLLRQALEVYPSFWVAANDLQALLIEKGKAEPKWLEPYAGKKWILTERVPNEVNENQAAALLMDERYGEAWQISNQIVPTERNRMLRALCGVFSGRLEGNADVVAESSPRNAVVMALVQKKNEQALRLCDNLPANEAMTHYLRTVCHCRLDHAVEAEQEFAQAIKLDPELAKIAKSDADISIDIDKIATAK